jgi:hypothetical protein
MSDDQSLAAALLAECAKRLKKKGKIPIYMGSVGIIHILQWDMKEMSDKTLMSCQLNFYSDRVDMEMGSSTTQIWWPFKSFIYADPKFPTNLYRNF